MRSVRQVLTLVLAGLVVAALLARAHVHGDDPSAAPPCQACAILHDGPGLVSAGAGDVAPAMLVATLAPATPPAAAAGRRPFHPGRGPPASPVGPS